MTAPVTRRSGRGRRLRARPVWFTDQRPATVNDLLTTVPDGMERVVTAGPRWFDRIADLRRFAMSKLPDGWLAGAHYLPNVDAPILRFRRPDGSGVEVIAGQTWFGPGVDVADAGQVGAAYWNVQRFVDRAFGVSALMPTPATTGRECFLASIPQGVEYPVMSAELRELVSSTSGQGRIETFPHLAGRRIEHLAEVDGRFMYAGLARDVPVGLPELVRGEPEDPYRKARHAVHFKVPACWDQPGLIGVHDDGQGWRYPSSPGEVGRAWIDGAELMLARRCGWQVHVFESLVWPKPARQGVCQPLRSWAAKIIAERDHVEQLGPERDPHGLYRAALRKLCIDAIGAFVSRPYRVQHWQPIDRPELVPVGARNATVQGDAIVYDLPAENRWRESIAHPEWAAHIWAKARARMASAVIDLAPASVLVGIATDAMYLGGEVPARYSHAGPVPVGALRVKHDWPGPFNAPASRTELYRTLHHLRRQTP